MGTTTFSWQNVHSHETLRQASDVLVAQDVEISALREQLRAVQSLEAETEEILQDLETVCKRSQHLEKRTTEILIIIYLWALHSNSNLGRATG